MWESLPLTAPKPSEHYSGSARGFAVIGPGLVACLANCDVGSIITMAVTGAESGYILLPFQLLLIPALIAAQDLAVRLGACTHRSLVGLAFDHMSRGAGIAVLVACISVCMITVVSQFAGIAAVGELWGIPPWISCPMGAGLLLAVVLRCRFGVIEKIAIGFGTCLCSFLLLVALCHPSIPELAAGLRRPFGRLWEPGVRQLMVANVGSVMTPWTLFYQLSAVAEKRVGPDDLGYARADMSAGAICMQLIMASVLMVFAHTAHAADLLSLPLHEALSAPLAPFIGAIPSKLIVSVGLLGASLLGALVASLTLAWNCADAIGAQGVAALEGSFLEAPWFYTGFFMSILIGAITMAFRLVSLVTVNVYVQAMNGFAMPLTVGVLYLLARGEALPPSLRIQGYYAAVLGVMLVACSIMVFSCALL